MFRELLPSWICSCFHVCLLVFVFKTEWFLIIISLKIFNCFAGKERKKNYSISALINESSFNFSSNICFYHCSKCGSHWHSCLQINKIWNFQAKNHRDHLKINSENNTIRRRACYPANIDITTFNTRSMHNQRS